MRRGTGRRAPQGRWRRAGARKGALLGILALAAIAAACGEPERDAPAPTPPPSREQPERPPLFEPGQTQSRDAVPDSLAILREDLEQPRHPADGKGRAWLEPSPDGEPPMVSQRAAFSIVFEAGPLGVAVGGAVYLQTSPFWDWDSPQASYPDAPGYTSVETEAQGVELVTESPGNQLLAIRIEGRSLAEGERLRIVYGAGPAGARVDRYAERESPLWIAVDGDGDGVRAILPDSPTVVVRARPPEQLILTLPTAALPGQTVRLTAALVDRTGNAGFPFLGVVTLWDLPPGLDLPSEIEFGAGDAGSKTVEGRVSQDGVFRVRGRVVAEDGALPIESESNPMLVRAGAQRVCWGDLHGHSAFSDGTGTPEDYYDYARNVSALDVAALTDHDHFGMRFLDATPEWWARIGRSVAQFHEPGRFVTLLGYEWTSWLHGHRHVLYFEDEGEIYSSLDPRTETPTQLWAALRGQRALTFAHHSAGSAISTNWAFAPDPELEPVTEITSIHGSSEALDSPLSISKPVAGNFVRDAVDYGYRLGFIGSGDSHDGHPGLVQLAIPGSSGGLAAILCEALTRDAVLAALRARRVYATNGPRIWLDVSLGGTPMGQTRPQGGPALVPLEVEVVADAPIAAVELVRGQRLMLLAKGEGVREIQLAGEIPRLEAGESIYVRVVQEDRGAAWSSPIWAAARPSEETPASESSADAQAR